MRGSMENFFKRRRKEKEEYTKVTFRDKYKKGHSGAGKVVRIVLSVLLILFLPESTEGVAECQTTAIENNYTENDV